MVGGTPRGYNKGMAILVTLRGPNPGKQFPLEGETASIGRHAESAVFLESQAVSRHHARVLCEGDQFFIEDLNSSNGTFLNGKRIQQRTPLVEQDTLQIGPYFLGLRQTPVPAQCWLCPQQDFRRRTFVCAHQSAPGSDS